MNMTRLTDKQKYIGILTVLDRSFYPMSTTAIGQALGFANGEPIKFILPDLVIDQHIFATEDTMFGDACQYWTISPMGEEWLQKFRNGEIDL